MIVNEMPAVIRPYSIVVAPDLLFMKRETKFFIGSPIYTWLVELKFWSRRHSRHRDRVATLNSENFGPVNSIVANAYEAGRSCAK